jgi:hypothetical protein
MCPPRVRTCTPVVVSDELSEGSLKSMILNTLRTLARHGADVTVASNGLHTLCGLVNSYQARAVEVVLQAPDCLGTLSGLLAAHASAQPVLCLRALSVVREVCVLVLQRCLHAIAACCAAHELPVAGCTDRAALTRALAMGRPLCSRARV